jgi:hypothetical protein
MPPLWQYFSLSASQTSPSLPPKSTNHGPPSSSFPANQAFLEDQDWGPDVPFMDPRVAPPVGDLVAAAVMGAKVMPVVAVLRRLPKKRQTSPFRSLKGVDDELPGLFPANLVFCRERPRHHDRFHGP